MLMTHYYIKLLSLVNTHSEYVHLWPVLVSIFTFMGYQKLIVQVNFSPLSIRLQLCAWVRSPVLAQAMSCQSLPNYHQWDLGKYVLFFQVSCVNIMPIHIEEVPLSALFLADTGKKVQFGVSNKSSKHTEHDCNMNITNISPHLLRLQQQLDCRAFFCMKL